MLMILSFMLYPYFGQAQSGKDTTAVRTEPLKALDNLPDSLIFHIKGPGRLTVGLEFDFINAMPGIQISNAYDEEPLIHFEDFADGFILKAHAHSDFHKDYAYGMQAGLLYPFWRIHHLSAGYEQYRYWRRGFCFKEFHVEANTYTPFFKSFVHLKIAYHKRYQKKRLGLEAGIMPAFYHQHFYLGISGGYFGEYYTYSAYLQTYYYKNLLGLRLEFRQIDRFGFFNVGVHFIFKRTSLIKL